jgi:hypothetical protein
MPHDDPSAGRRGVRTNRFTLMADKKQTGEIIYFLYDNLMDPYQLENIASAEPETVQELTSELDRWLEKANDNWNK